MIFFKKRKKINQIDVKLSLNIYRKSMSGRFCLEYVIRFIWDF